MLILWSSFERLNLLKVTIKRVSMKIVVNKAILGSFVLGIVIGALLIIVFGFTGAPTGMAALTPNEAGKRAIDFINENLVRGDETVSLVSVEEVSGVYKVLTSYMGREIPVYITKDGTLLFLSRPVNTTQKLPKPEEEAKFDAPDREKPNVKFFVMSFCPFGNQAENGLAPVFKLLGEDKVEWEPHYVIYSDYGGYPDYCLDENETYCSMHGIQELHQDIREMCIWKYYDHTTWWDFVLDVNKECNARNADECWKPIAEKHGINVTQIEECVENEAVELLQHELELNKQYGVRGSPTVFINDVQYRGSRSPEAYKQAICSGFANPPAECNETLSGESGAAGQC